MEKKIRVRFNGGREGNKKKKKKKTRKKLNRVFELNFLILSDVIVIGTLMGYDPLLNLVLDNTIEYQKGKIDTKLCTQVIMT